ARTARGVTEQVCEFLAEAAAQRDADTLIVGSGALFERELRGQREGGVAQARQVESGDIHVLDGYRGIDIERAFRADGEFAGVGGRSVKAGVGAIDRVREEIDRRQQGAAVSESKDSNSVRAGGKLLEAVEAILLNGIVKVGKRIPIVENAGASAKD